MAVARLSEPIIQKALRTAALERHRVEVIDAAVPGLRLRVTAGGTGSWSLFCRDREGRMRRFPLGEYPAIGLKEAREGARTMRVDVRQKGADPVADARRERTRASDAKHGIGTLSAVLDAYALQEGTARKSWPEARRRIESVFKSHLDRSTATLTARELQLTADGYKARMSAAAAVRYLRPVLKWAAKRGTVPMAALGVEPVATVKRRDRVLSESELTSVLRTLRQRPDGYSHALRFAMLTLSRRGEIEAARWADVDMDAALWTIPETKNGVPHRIPLSPQGLALLQDIGPGEPGDLVFRTTTGAALGNWDRQTKAIHVVSGTAGWHRHDLRRTGATLLGEMGVEPHVIEAALNHVAIHSSLATTYNKARYLPAVRRALDMLGVKLMEIEGAQPIREVGDRAAA